MNKLIEELQIRVVASCTHRSIDSSASSPVKISNTAENMASWRSRSDVSQNTDETVNDRQHALNGFPFMLHGEAPGKN